MDIEKYKALAAAGVVNKVVKAGSDEDTTENDVVWWDTEDKGGRENDLARTNRRGSDTYDRHSI